MTIANIGELLDHTVEFEQRLERYCARVRDMSRDNNTRLLAYYVGRHHRHIPDILTAYSPQAIGRIRRIRLKHKIRFAPERKFHAIRTPPAKVPGKDLLEAAIGYTSALMDLYGQILSQPLAGRSRQLVAALIRLEERDVVTLREMAAINYF